MSHLVYVDAHINYLLFSTCFLLNISLTIYVRIRNLTATLKRRIDIDRIDSNSNFASTKYGILLVKCFWRSDYKNNCSCIYSIQKKNLPLLQQLLLAANKL